MTAQFNSFLSSYKYIIVFISRLTLAHAKQKFKNLLLVLELFKNSKNLDSRTYVVLELVSLNGLSSGTEGFELITVSLKLMKFLNCSS